MGRPNGVETSSADGEKIHLRQNKRDRSLSNIPQGSNRQDSGGETVCEETVVDGCS